MSTPMFGESKNRPKTGFDLVIRILNSRGPLLPCLAGGPVFFVSSGSSKRCGVTGGPAFGLLDGAYKAGAPFFA